ncbi:MAG: plasmid maintenance system killer [Myxococcales bacterium]|nr:plasmid maintenance system killer [Myxococcales bacterium]
MIRSFADIETEKLFRREWLRRLPPDIQRTALRKLVQLDAVITLEDLRVPPGNRLEVLSGNRVGQHTIRINDQWRVCFVWKTDGAENVEIVDYH